MKLIQYVLGILSVFAFIFVLLITSVEAVAYWLPGYYEKEYAKYQVTEAVQMEMSDLLTVTDEMMSYLKGNRDNLHITTTVNGQQREFFNAREIAHMEDVRDLFVGAIALRRYCILFIVLAIVALVLLKADIAHILPRSLCFSTGLFLAAAAILAGIIATDFTKYFTIFHEIFFDNDLWILDPTTDLLINIVPEPFFVDTAALIGLVFGGTMLTLLIICITMIYMQKKK